MKKGSASASGLGDKGLAATDTPRSEALAVRKIPEPSGHHNDSETRRPPRSARDPTRMYVENPPKQLAAGNEVHIETDDSALARASNEEISFWLRLKGTPGCTSKRNHITSVMHLYITPDSPAAHLFVSRMIKKLKAAPPPRHSKTLLANQMKQLLPGKEPWNG
jgi:hypothetical protein